MSPAYREHLERILSEISAAGLEKIERPIASAQGARVRVEGGRSVLNLCANNYLGLANHPEVVAAARQALDRWGYGLASVRFICGTQDVHKELESVLSRFLGTDDTILYSSCFDANGGVFETLLGGEDAVISDELNHASIIDGIRLCRASRYRYRNRDIGDLDAKLADAARAGARFKLVVTDGVFSMDGTVAPLREICDVAERHGASVMVDDSHAVGFMGPGGGGTPDHFGVRDRVDLLTGTLGKALGGASGGYASGRRPMIDLLRQRSRPYLFSNTLPPAIVAASIASIGIIRRSPELRDRLHANTLAFRAGLAREGFAIGSGTHPIVLVMLGEASLAQRFAARMLEEGVYVVGFFHPVVPQGAARIRTQVSAAHEPEDLQRAVRAFALVGKELAR
jgi:glycine C-acetyltransferase